MGANTTGRGGLTWAWTERNDGVSVRGGRRLRRLTFSGPASRLDRLPRLAFEGSHEVHPAADNADNTPKDARQAEECRDRPTVKGTKAI